MYTHVHTCPSHSYDCVRLTLLSKENDITIIQMIRNLTFLTSLMDNLPVIRLPAFREGWLPSKFFPIHS